LKLRASGQLQVRAKFNGRTPGGAPAASFNVLATASGGGSARGNHDTARGVSQLSLGSRWRALLSSILPNQHQLGHWQPEGVAAFPLAMGHGISRRRTRLVIMSSMRGTDTRRNAGCAVWHFVLKLQVQRPVKPVKGSADQEATSLSQVICDHTQVSALQSLRWSQHGSSPCGARSTRRERYT
jgi:hypothetical protein